VSALPQVEAQRTVLRERGAAAFLTLGAPVGLPPAV